MLLSLSESEERYRDRFEYLSRCMVQQGQTDPETGEILPKPSARALMERFGGSMNTNNDRMTEFWAIVGRNLELRKADFGGIPEHMIQAMGKMLDQSREVAVTELKEARAAFEQEKADYSAEVQKQKDTIQSMGEELANLGAEFEKIKALAAEHADIIEAMKQAEAELRSTLSSEQARTASLENEKTNLQREAVTKADEIRRLNTELTDAKRIAADLQTRNSLLEGDAAKSKVTAENAVREVERLASDKQELADQLTVVRDELTRTETRRVYTLERFEKALAEIDALKESHAQRVDEINKKLINVAASESALRNMVDAQEKQIERLWSKLPSEAAEDKKAKESKRDEDTVDAFDGKTDKERKNKK